MTDTKRPRGYFEKLLVVDCETSGMAFNCDDPSYNPKTGEVYQSVSWGLIVANAQTLKPIEEKYLEIKWDGESKWEKRAQQVHGLSLEHLEKNGLDAEEAVTEIAGLILNHWGPDSPICLCGHNVATFDMWFLKRLLRSQEIEVKFGNRHVDTNSIGFGAYTTYNSDDLFAQVGCPERDPNKHNALDDARNALQAVRVTRQLFSQCLGE
jgi:DNA polymerase III epsilon subunit-like protein